MRYLMILMLFPALYAQTKADLPDAPSAVSEDDRNERIGWWVLTAVDVAATAADAAVSTHSHFRPGMGNCHEGNALFGGPYPSAKRIWTQQMAGAAGVTALTWVLKRHRQHWWALLAFIDATMHTVATVNTASECF